MEIIIIYVPSTDWFSSYCYGCSLHCRIFWYRKYIAVRLKQCDYFFSCRRTCLSVCFQSISWLKALYCRCCTRSVWAVNAAADSEYIQAFLQPSHIIASHYWTGIVIKISWRNVILQTFGLAAIAPWRNCLYLKGLSRRVVFIKNLDICAGFCRTSSDIYCHSCDISQNQRVAAAGAHNIIAHVPVANADIRPRRRTVDAQIFALCRHYRINAVVMNIVFKPPFLVFCPSECVGCNISVIVVSKVLTAVRTINIAIEHIAKIVGFLDIWNYHIAMNAPSHVLVIIVFQMFPFIDGTLLYLSLAGTGDFFHADKIAIADINADMTTVMVVPVVSTMVWFAAREEYICAKRNIITRCWYNMWLAIFQRAAIRALCRAHFLEHHLYIWQAHAAITIVNFILIAGKKIRDFCTGFSYSTRSTCSRCYSGETIDRWKNHRNCCK